MQDTPPSNVLELHVVRLALTSFSDILRDKRVLFQMDNISTVYYFSKQGGTGSQRLCLEAIAAWEMA